MNSSLQKDTTLPILLTALMVLGGCELRDSPSSPDAGAATADTLAHFSFFVTSLKAIQDLSVSEDGFGGNLTYGETGAGAGLRGADKICTDIAERSMLGSSVKQWRAFLSVTADENGQPVNAIDRIGEGPWYDRLGRLVAPSRADLLSARPQNGHPGIQNDLPNEDGVPNRQPDPNLPPVDNHHMLTGSGTSGELYSSNATCQDWTTAGGNSSNGSPRAGLAWPRRSGTGTHWISELSVPGCAPGVGTEGRPPPGSDDVGSGGGYGGIYCFALEP